MKDWKIEDVHAALYVIVGGTLTFTAILWILHW